MTISGSGDVILLDHKEIITNEEILEITQGHAKLFQANRSEEGKKGGAGRKKTYISFRLHHLFGVPIEEVREIINYSEEVSDAPGMPDSVKGMLNLRGKLVTIIDTRALYKIGSDTSVSLSDAKILIFQKGNDLFGLVVNSVESILSVEMESKLKMPELLAGTGNDSFDQDVEEVLSRWI